MLTVRDIEVCYQGAVIAVQGASLEVPDRGVVALLGANGAGKTTILRAIGGMLRFHGGRITRGTVEFDSMRIDTLDATRIVRLGIAHDPPPTHACPEPSRHLEHVLHRGLRWRQRRIKGGPGVDLSKKTIDLGRPLISEDH